MKITFRNKNGQRETIETKIVEIEDKIGGRYRIQNDFEKGIEITAEHSDRIYVEPRYGNQLTVIAVNEI